MLVSNATVSIMLLIFGLVQHNDTQQTVIGLTEINNDDDDDGDVLYFNKYDTTFAHNCLK